MLQSEGEICEHFGITKEELGEALNRVDFEENPTEQDYKISEAYDEMLNGLISDLPEGWKHAGPAALTTLIMHDSLVEEGIDPDMFKAQLKGEIP